MKVPRFGHFAQHGAEVQKFGIKRGIEIFESLRGRWLEGGEGRQRDELTFIGHQANLRMLEAITRRCGIPRNRHVFNIDRRGNVGAAGAPSVFSEHWGEPELGRAIALCVVGSGLTWAGTLFERVDP